MKKKKSNGTRLGSFRSGDRSEYMALYFLSRVAFVSQIPRQEDFGGVDFLCCLGNEQDNEIYAENAFFVQVKANKRRIEFNKSASNWIRSHMDLPLIICVAEKNKNSIDIYSTWRIWWGIVRTPAFVRNINLNLNNKKFKSGEIFEENNGQLYVAIGEPILHVNYNELEDTCRQEELYERLKFWLNIDRTNIFGIKEHGVFVNGVNCWKTNEIPESHNLETYYTFNVDNTKMLEWSVTKNLTALGIYYKKSGQKTALEMVENVTNLFSSECQEHFQSQLSPL